MPAHHKGERKQFSVRPPIEVVPTLEALWRESGVSSISQYLADLVTIHAGRPDLARELGKTKPQEQVVLPLAM